MAALFAICAALLAVSVALKSVGAAIIFACFAALLYPFLKG